MSAAGTGPGPRPTADTGPGPRPTAPAGDEALDAELLEILRCPACRGSFGPPAPGSLTCTACGRRYPVRNGIPVLLVDEAARPGSGR